jgi:prolipoprotein diacylglyceryl transferase
MLPVLYKFTLDTEGSRTVLYLVALALVAYAAWSGWRNAIGPLDPKTGQPTAPSRQDRQRRAVIFGVIGVGLAALGLYYALPQVPLLGIRGRGEGIPIHTYGILVGGGFIAAVTVSAWLAQREWPGELGLKRRDQVFDLAFYVFIGAIIGSRELFILVNYKKYSSGDNPVEGYAVVLDLLVLVALVVAVPLRDRFFKKETAEKLRQNAFHIFVGTFLGGRVLFSFGTGHSLGSLADMLGGGLVFYGGLIGAVLTSLWYTAREGIEFMRLADLAMPTVSLGQAFGRLGCFSAGCCWGGFTKAGAKLAVVFPGPIAKNIFGGLGGVPSLAYSSEAENAADSGGRYILESTGQVFHQAVPGSVRIADWVAQHGHTLPVWPTQLFESAGQLMVFAALLTMRRFRRFHGEIFGIWLMCYAVLRSTVEVFRGDLERGTLNSMLQYFGWFSLAGKVPLEAWYNISISQFISICMFALGAWVVGRNLSQMKDRVVDLKPLAVG